MIFYRSAVTPSRPLIFDEDIDFSGISFAKDFPLLGISSCHVKGIVEKNGEFLTLNAEIKATLTLADSRTLKPFNYPVSSKEVFDLLESNEQDGEGYVYPDNKIDLTDVIYHALRSLVPAKPLKKGSKLPKGIEGVNVYTQDEFEALDTPKPSPFDALADYPFDEDEDS